MIYRPVEGKHTAHGGYHLVRRTRVPALSIKPNRNAAGMAYTAARLTRGQGHSIGAHASPLLLYGTHDALRSFTLFIERRACACCGSKNSGKFGLSDRGWLQLDRLRRNRNARLDRRRVATLKLVEA